MESTPLDLAVKPPQQVRLPDVATAVALSDSHPGAIIPGLGQLYKARPLHEPQKAYRKAEGTPDPDEMAYAMDLKRRLNKDIDMDPNLDHLTLRLLDGVLQGRLQLTDDEVVQIITFRKFRLLQALKSITPTGLMSQIETFRQQEIARLQSEAEEAIRGEKERTKEMTTTGFDKQKEYYPDKSDQEIIEMRQAAEKRRVDEIEKRLAADLSSPKFGDISWTLLKYRDFMGRNYYQQARDESTLHTINALEIFVYKLQMFDKKIDEALGIYQRKRTSHGAPEPQPSPDLLNSILSELIPSLDKMPELKGYVIQQALKNDSEAKQASAADPAGKQPKPFSRMIVSMLESGNLPADYILDSFLTDTPHYPVSSQDLPERLKKIYQQEINNHSGLDSDDRFHAYLALLRLRGEKIDTEKVETLFEYLAKHRISGTDRGDESGEYHRRGSRLVNAHADYEAFQSDNWVENFVLADPSLPSQEALQEIRDRGNLVEIDIDQQSLLPYWQIASRMAKKHGIDPQEWYNWILATKRLGLGAVAKKERNAVSPYFIFYSKRKEDLLSDHMEGAKDARFPEVEEIWDNISRRTDARPRRNSGVEAWWEIALPLRIDREEGFKKYKNLHPSEWRKMYSAVSKIWGADYNRDNSPDSFIAALHGSMMCVLGGGYEQYYKGMDDYSQHANMLDEFDVLMMLPDIAESNKNDPGFLMMGVKLVLQMDDNLRAMYVKEIEECLLELVVQTRGLYTIYQSGNIENVPETWIPESNLRLNLSHKPERRRYFDEQAITVYENSPHEPFRISGPVVCIMKSKAEPDDVLGRIIPKDLAVKAYDLQPGDVIEGRTFQGTTFAESVAFILHTNPDEYDIGPIEQWNFEKYGIHPDSPDIVYFLPKPWTDPDIRYNPATGELKTKIPDVVLPDASTAIERLHQSNPEMATLIEEVAEREANTNLTPLAEAADIMSFLLGVPISNSDLSVILARMDQARGLVMQLQLPQPMKKNLALVLEEAPSPHSLTFEGMSQLVWAASGYLEREAVAYNVITGVTSSWMLGVRRVFDRIREHRVDRYMQELSGVYPEMPPEELRLKADEAVAWSFYRLRSLFEQELDALYQKNSPAAPADTVTETGNLRLQRNMIKSCLQVSQEITATTDYNYTSTHWFQVFDQLFGKAADGADFLDSEGRINLYCVQLAHMVREAMVETFKPSNDFPLFQQPEFHIILEDEQFNLNLQQYFAYLRNGGKSRTLGVFNHYMVLVKLPLVQEGDKQFYLMIDPTESKAKLFSQDDIVSSSDMELIINDAKVRRVSPDGNRHRSGDDKEIRILLTKNIGGMAFNTTAEVMSGFDHLKDYGYRLSQEHPRTLFDRAVDFSESSESRRGALIALISRYPYFIGEDRFYKPFTYSLRMITLMQYCQSNDLPVIGLYATRTLQCIQKSDLSFDKSYLKSFYYQCALLTDSEWNNQKAQYANILLPEDMEKIEQLRLQRKEELERKLREEQKIRDTALDRDYAKYAKAAFDERDAHDALPENEKKAEQPGARERTGTIIDTIEAHGRAVELALSDDLTNALPAPTDTKVIKTLQGERNVRRKKALKLKPAASRQAADFLIKGMTPLELSTQLPRIAAYWRATVHDALLEADGGATFIQLETAMRQAITDSTGMFLEHPLGPRRQLLELPPEEIRQRLTTSFPHSVPPLLKPQTSQLTSGSGND